LLTYSIKKSYGKPQFRKELITGGLCGIGRTLLAGVFFILSLFDANSVTAGAGHLFSNNLYTVILFIAVLYTILMQFNIVMQSLKSALIKDAVLWYGSPLIIITAQFIGIQMFFQFIPFNLLFIK
jgi:hypothetical protein